MNNDRVFIEEQFPVSKVSKESYKERKSHQGQTLTSLGKWWGRKPLVLVRAVIVGLLLPVSNDPAKDRDIFLKIMTMDEEGLLRRIVKAIPVPIIKEKLNKHEWECLIFNKEGKRKKNWQSGLTEEEKGNVRRKVFKKMSYDERLEYCARPEEIDGPSSDAWNVINRHLGLNVQNIQELIVELGKKRFGHLPTIGDAFCGGGSIPYESAKIGCNVYAADLNPVAALLTWAALNLADSEEKQSTILKEQTKLFNEVESQIINWGIEHNKKGWRANAFLFCTEIKCPSCGILLPLSNSWAIGPRSRVVARIIEDKNKKVFKIEIQQNATNDEIKKAKETATYKNKRIYCPSCGIDNSLDSAIMAAGKLRLWDKDDFMPRPNDVYQERLYCIRWIETYQEKNPQGKLVTKTRYHYRSLDKEDISREETVISLLKEYFSEWQKKGYLPSRKIDKEGEKTEEPIRTRGWTYWHHLFTPRQLLVHGLINSKISKISHIATLLGVGKIANWDSKLCGWGTGAARESIAQTFYNQALNPLFHYAGKALPLTKGTLFVNPPIAEANNPVVETKDARRIVFSPDIWITDPPYADAINYHELTDFFLAWYEKSINKFFPDWYIDTKKALAVRGAGVDFKKSLVEIYTNLTEHMPDNGMQVVMFTHQDASVWADLGMILWASKLHVTSAWTIATETTTGIKQGNYVQGTVILILKKRNFDETAFLDELYPEIEDEVRHQLDHMLRLDDQDEPNFADTDYQLAAYAAALRILTQYNEIEGHDILHELFRERQQEEKSAFENVIDRAVEIASDHLVPGGLEQRYWKILSASERLYLKGLELEKHMEARSGAYQELAKGFGVRDYTSLFHQAKANAVRFKTGSEFKRTALSSGEFGDTTMRNILFAIHETSRTDDARQGLNWLREEVPTYWDQRKQIVAILNYLAALAHISHMTHWGKDADAAQRLSGAVENDHEGRL